MAAAVVVGVMLHGFLSMNYLPFVVMLFYNQHVDVAFPSGGNDDQLMVGRNLHQQMEALEELHY